MTRHILSAALALTTLAVPAWSAVLVPTDDTYSTLTFSGKPPAVTKSSLKSVSGAAATLPVSKTSNAFIQFNVADFQIPAASVRKATLTLFFPTVTKPGDLQISTVLEDWTEKFVGPTKLQPAFGAAFATIPSARVVAKQFVKVDVTAQVVAWLTTPSTDFGFAIFADANGISKVGIGAKEGSGSGYPATLEIETNGASEGGNFVFSGGNVGVNIDPIFPLEVATNIDGVGAGGSVESSMTLNLLNTASSGGLNNANVAGLGFGKDTIRQAIVGGTFGNDFLKFYTGGDLVAPKFAIDFNGLASFSGNIFAQGGGTFVGTLGVGGNTGLGGNVGIGTEPSAFKLDVATNSNTQIALRSTSANGRVWALQSSLGDPVNGNGTFQIVDRTPGGNNPIRFMISKDGDSGIGTSIPTAKLDVRGNVKLGAAGEFFAIGSTENLRLIRGLVEGATPGSVAGSGYSVTRVPNFAFGGYRVTFSTTFLDAVVVTANAISGNPKFATVSNATFNSCDIYIYGTNGVLVDSDFVFTGIGKK